MRAGPKFKWKPGAAAVARSALNYWSHFHTKATSSEVLVPTARINLSRQQFKRRRNRDFENNEIYCHCGWRLALPLPDTDRTILFCLRWHGETVPGSWGRLSERCSKLSKQNDAGIDFIFRAKGATFGWMALKSRLWEGSHWIKR